MTGRDSIRDHGVPSLCYLYTEKLYLPWLLVQGLHRVVDVCCALSRGNTEKCLYTTKCIYGLNSNKGLLYFQELLKTGGECYEELKECIRKIFHKKKVSVNKFEDANIELLALYANYSTNTRL